MTDNELIQEILRGREEYLKSLMDKYSGLIYRVLSRFCRNRFELEELIQDVWVKVFWELRKGRKVEYFKAWLVRIAYYLGIDFLRRKRKQGEMPKEEGEIESIPAEWQETQQILWQEVKKLKIRYQIPLVLFFFERFTYEEIAAAMGEKLNTIRSLIRRAKTILKKKLEERGLNLWNL